MARLGRLVGDHGDGVMDLALEVSSADDAYDYAVSHGALGLEAPHLLEDESGKDEKIVCVPHDKVHPQFKDNTELATLPAITLKVIEHFFTRYKDLEPGKWVKVVGWGDRAAAEAAIESAIKAFAVAKS